MTILCSNFFVSANIVEMVRGFVITSIMVFLVYCNLFMIFERVYSQQYACKVHKIVQSGHFPNKWAICNENILYELLKVIMWLRGPRRVYMSMKDSKRS